MNTEIRELDVAELDQVSGGHFLSAFVRPVPLVDLPRFGAAEPDSQGGQNDPAQMFQQILQQLTQGQA
jgi:hypothetical protein